MLLAELEAGGSSASPGNLKMVDEEEEEDASSSSSSGGTSTRPKDPEKSATGDVTQTGGSSSESSTLAKAETAAVQRSKLLVLFVLTLAAIGISVATYIFVRAAETQEFEDKFHDYALEMESLIHDEARNSLLTMNNFAMGITSESLSRHVTWPFMTIPHLEVRGTRLNELSHNLMMSFSPLVAQDEREDWEVYTQDMQGWIQEGLDYDTEWITANRRSRRQLLDTNISSTIHRGSLDSAKQDPNPARFPEEGPGPYLPVWQLVPAPHNPSVVNYNLLSHEIFERLYHFVNQTKSPIVSEVFDLEFLYGGSIHEDPTHPFSVLMQPIFEDFEKDSRLVGVLTAVLPWDHYLENILPKGVNVIVVVMEDTCGDSMTYAITGPEAEFIGYGDYHDPKYDDMQASTLFSQLPHNFSSEYEYCEYSLYFYPTESLEQEYRSMHPILYAGLVFFVFIVTAVVFCMYDLYVTTRQNKVMLAAAKSNAVVASLFPKNVRKALLAEAEEQILANQKLGFKPHAFKLGAAPKSELKNFLEDGLTNAAGVAFETKPIADLFPSTTVM